MVDPSAADVLTTAYHTIICSVLQTWSQPPVLSPLAVVDFVQATLNSLPSSSSARSGMNHVGSDFGEILVDVIWSVDSALEEPIQEHKAASAPETAKANFKLEQQKVTAERDKEAIQQIVRRLLVSVLKSTSGIYNSSPIQELRLIDPGLCRERLDSAVLAGVGLIQDKSTLDKKEIRSRTGLLYVFLI